MFWHVLNDFATFIIAIYEGKLRFATQIIVILGKTAIICLRNTLPEYTPPLLQLSTNRVLVLCFFISNKDLKIRLQNA